MPVYLPMGGELATPMIDEIRSLRGKLNQNAYVENFKRQAER